MVFNNVQNYFMHTYKDGFTMANLILSNKMFFKNDLLHTGLFCLEKRIQQRFPLHVTVKHGRIMHAKE